MQKEKKIAAMTDCQLLTGQVVKVAKRHCSFMRSVAFEATSDVDGCALFMGTFPELVGFVINGQSGFKRRCFPII